MKTIKYFLLTTVLLFQSISSLQAQNTEGTEFWLAFGKINSATNASTGLEFQIRIVNGNYNNTVTLYFTDSKTYHYINLVPYEIKDYYLDNEQRLASYNFILGTTHKSIHITSNEPVSVFASNAWGPSMMDITNVLPKPALGTEYYHISYIPSNGFMDAFAVVATQNNTLLYHNKNYVTTLQEGQVYYYPSASDLTRDYITSNHPVAFFATNQSANIPVWTLMGTYLWQQLCPVNTWDKTFFVPITIFEKDIIRIVASQNNTTITQTGGILRTDVPGAQNTLTNLQAGQFVELAVFLDSAGCYIKTDKPVEVCSYIAGIHYTGKPSLSSQCWIPGIGQTVTRALFSPFSPFDAPLWAFYVLIISPTATKDDTRVSIGGNTPEPLSGGEWIDKADAKMSFYSMPLIDINASYIFSNPKGMILFSYGTGNSFTMRSYYYLAYSAMRDLDAMFYGNDIHFQDFKKNPFCESLVEFRAEIDGKGIELDTVKWFINGAEEVAERNKLEWHKTFSPGEYEIKMWVHFENDDTLSKTGTLVRINCNQELAFYANEVHYEALQDTTFCNKTVHFRAETGELSTEPGHIRWYIDYNDGSGYVEELSALDHTQWSKDFANGTYPVKMWVLFENSEEATITSTLKIQTLWIKMRNVRY